MVKSWIGVVLKFRNETSKRFQLLVQKTRKGVVFGDRRIKCCVWTETIKGRHYSPKGFAFRVGISRYGLMRRVTAQVWAKGESDGFRETAHQCLPRLTFGFRYDLKWFVARERITVRNSVKMLRSGDGFQPKKNLKITKDFKIPFREIKTEEEWLWGDSTARLDSYLR